MNVGIRALNLISDGDLLVRLLSWQNLARNSALLHECFCFSSKTASRKFLVGSFRPLKSTSILLSHYSYAGYLFDFVAF